MNTDLIKKIDNLYYYQTDEFATIYIKHFFTFENTKRNYVISEILSRYMEETNRVYKSQKKIKDKERSLYGAHFVTSTENKGTKMFFSFTLKIIDQQIIGESFFKEALIFFKKMMLKPNFQNEELDQNILTEIKKDLISSKKNLEKNPEKFHTTLLYRNMLPESDFNNKRLYSKELEEILASLTDKDIIDFYYNLLNHYIAGYAFGNLNDEEIKLISNSFDFKPIPFDFKYDCKETISKDYKVITSKDTSQSYLYVFYEIKDYKKCNSYIYKSMINIFNGLNGLCIKELRYNLGLVYNAYSEFLFNRGLFMICAQIDKRNVDKALEGIDDIMKQLDDKEIIQNLLTYSKEVYNQNLYTNTENLACNLNDLERYILKYENIYKDLVNKINEITVEDIQKQASNFEKKYIFFYEGDKDEK